MNHLDNVMRGLMTRASAEPAPEDFQRGGLWHCGVCGMAKECRIEYDGALMTVPCICRCGEEQLAREKRRQADEERMLRAMSLRGPGIQDRAVRSYTFAGAEESRNIARCRAYARRWPEMLESNTGLLFWGGVGTGKTFAAACIANAVIDQGVPVLVTSFPKLLNSGWDKTELTAQMKHFPLLVLDDLGAERESDYSLEIVQQVVDERYKTGCPVIITTNLTLAELENPRDLRYARIYDRVLELCIPVQFAGPSRRQLRRREKLRLAQEGLG